MRVINFEGKLYQKAFNIAIFIAVYNVFEGIASVVFGYENESLALFGFGVDSFIEVASNLSLIYMINRIQHNLDADKTVFERSALKVTGYGFFILSGGLLIGAVTNIIQDNKPQSTVMGIIISTISIFVMLFVSLSQLKTGKILKSNPIIADAKCALVCLYMSITLLLASLIYSVTGFQYADIIGVAGLVFFSVREGKEALEKAREFSHSDTPSAS